MNFKKIAKFPFLLVTFWISKLSRFIPRQKNKWLYGSHFGFADNSKYLFLDVSEHNPEIQSIWISHCKSDVSRIRNLGLTCYYWLSVRGLYHSFTASVYICTETARDINFFASEGAILVNLHHGVGLKRTFWDNDLFFQREYGKSKEELRNKFWFKVMTYIWLYRLPDLSLITSGFQAREIYMSAFLTPYSNCLFGLYPRDKVLLMPKKEIINKIEKENLRDTFELIEYLRKFKKIYLYMPTFRNDGSDFIEESGLNFESLNKALTHNDAILILKMHPKTNIDISYISKYTNILTLPKNTDMYYVLPFTDCLITDYSSIYCDYLLMNKECILFPFDKEKYQKKNMNLEQYDTYYRGIQAGSFSELLEIVKSNQDNHLAPKDYNFVMNAFWEYKDNEMNIVSAIKEKINK